MSVEVSFFNWPIICIMPSLRRSVKSPIYTPIGLPWLLLIQNSVVPDSRSFWRAMYFLASVAAYPYTPVHAINIEEYALFLVYPIMAMQACIRTCFLLINDLIDFFSQASHLWRPVQSKYLSYFARCALFDLFGILYAAIMP